MISCAPVPNKTNMEKALSFGDACRGNAVAFLNTLSGKAPSGSPQQEPVKKVSLKGAVLDMSESALPPEEQIYNQLRNKLMETYPGGVPDGEKLRIMLFELNKKGVGLDLSNSPEGKKAAIAVIGSWMKDGNITVDRTTGQVSLKEGSSVESQMVSVDKFLKPEKKDETKQDLSDLKEKYDKQGKELKEARVQVESLKLEIDAGKKELEDTKNQHLEKLSAEKEQTAKAEKQVTDVTRERDEANTKQRIIQDELVAAKVEVIAAQEVNETLANKLSAEKEKTAAVEQQVKDLSVQLNDSKTNEQAATQAADIASKALEAAENKHSRELSAEKDNTAEALKQRNALSKELGEAQADLIAAKDVNVTLATQLKELNERLAEAPAQPKKKDSGDETPQTEAPQS